MPTMGSESERTLYRVLQRANLTQYFDLFISQGGDDVNQLCEAGEEEFLEIMALVGMASKPLHVRRLQKALHDWLTNPDLYQPSQSDRRAACTPSKGSILASVPQAAARLSSSGQYWSSNDSSRPRGNDSSEQQNVYSQLSMSSRRNGDELQQDRASERMSRRQSPNSELDTDILCSSEWPQEGSPSVGQFASFDCPTPLSESQIQAIDQCAGTMAANLPMYAPRPLNMKKPVDREIEEVMNLPEDHPNRLDLLRKYSAIYGRFDSKRKMEKLMNMHEMLVNEAAAQLCRYRPTLLTRREDLFPLARQIVRDCGLQYSRTQARMKDSLGPTDVSSSKQLKLDSSMSGADAAVKALYNGIDPSEMEDSLNARSTGSQSPDFDNERSQSQADDAPPSQEPRLTPNNGGIKSELNEED